MEKISTETIREKKNRFLRSKPPIAMRVLILPNIDTMIDTLQQELVKIAALKSGMVWREKGEKSPKCLKIYTNNLLHNNMYFLSFLWSLDRVMLFTNEGVTFKKDPSKCIL